MINFDPFVLSLDLEVIYGGERKAIDITTSDLNQPGLQFTGYFDFFAYDRLQIIGKAEMSYLLGLDPAIRRERLRQYMQQPMPGIIICRNMQCPVELLEAAQASGIPLFRSRMVTTKFSQLAIGFINRCLAPIVTRHGVLMDVFGVGVMITGESGVGKSECALELVKRGHRLVADDVVEIRKVSDNRLSGEAPDTVRHFMEVRGVGIINIKNMFGVGAVINAKSIDLVIHLELWNDAKEYDRLGLNEEFVTILGVKLQRLTIPVRPGRNLAIILEVAASNHRLKQMGYNAAQELDKRLTMRISEAEEFS
jgi:HPr kinase/phosphorylase